MDKAVGAPFGQWEVWSPWVWKGCPAQQELVVDPSGVWCWLSAVPIDAALQQWGQKRTVERQWALFKWFCLYIVLLLKHDDGRTHRSLIIKSGNWHANARFASRTCWQRRAPRGSCPRSDREHFTGQCPPVHCSLSIKWFLVHCPWEAIHSSLFTVHYRVWPLFFLQCSLFFSWIICHSSWFLENCNVHCFLFHGAFTVYCWWLIASHCFWLVRVHLALSHLFAWKFSNTFTGQLVPGVRNDAVLWEHLQGSLWDSVLFPVCWLALE